MDDPHDRFLALFLATQEDLRAFLAAAVRDWSRADDLLQETAMALWRSFDRYDADRPFGAWARGIAAHLLYKEWDRARRGPKAVDSETLTSLLDAFARTDQEPIDHRRSALRRCLDGLDGKVRDLLHLRYHDDQGPEAIAAHTNMGLAAVKKSLTRAKAKLAACVERRLSLEQTDVS